MQCPAVNASHRVSECIVCLIPRLHDEAGSTSWLYERSMSSFVNVCNITPFK